MIESWNIASMRKGRDCMSKIMVAGFVQMETIVKVEDLPVPYKQFESTPDLVDTEIGGAGFNEAMALKWLGDEVDFMSMVARNMSRHQIEAYLKKNDVDLKTDYVLPIVDGMPTSVILY